MHGALIQSVMPNNNSMVEFRISTLKYIINIVLPHFDNYPLLIIFYLNAYGNIII